MKPSYDAGAPSKSLRTCVRCVMDTTDLALTFDDDGVCDHCRTFDSQVRPFMETQAARGGRDLMALAEAVRDAGRGREFDCIIGMSGGIDSSYLVHLAAELGLRPLVFHVDGGWNSQIAVNNIERIVDGLDLDLFTHVINWEEMRDLQLAFFRSGVPHVDFPQDYAFFAAMYRFAAEHRVKYVWTGANYATEGVRNPKNWVYHADNRQMRAIHRRFGERELAEFPRTSILYHKVFLPYFRGIRVVRPLNLARYVKDDARDLLMAEYGWEPYPQKHFESRFTRFYEGFWLPSRFGFDTRKVQFSSLILSGQMERSDALEQLSKPALDDETVTREFQYVADKMQITADELRAYHQLPLKTYRDYPNVEWLYTVGSWAMRKLGLELGGKR